MRNDRPETSGLPSGVRQDLLAGAITFAAIVLFIVNGGNSLGGFVRWASGMGPAADRVLAGALLLNIALVLFGWRRYRDLTREVQERTAAEERARLLASRDPLTGFLNRRALAERANALFADPATQALAVLAIDLDHFKSVNDIHGHSAGDALLRRAAVAIADTLPPNSLTARLGGDEFAAAFACTPGDLAALDAVAGRIVAALGRPFEVEGVQLRVCASVGVAWMPAPSGSVDALLRNADMAMYAAKHDGGSRFAHFDASMARQVADRQALEAALRQGIARNEFVPFYEQQVDFETGRLTGLEVLARWNHPELGILPPDRFLPLAEESGLVGEISMAVMRRAMEEARDWDGSLGLSINISAGQLRDPWLAQKIIKIIVETGFPAERLEFDITESSLFENMALARTTIASLKNQGAKLALDDFGTGYSSLAHLRALPFDRIKIDRSYVTSLDRNADSEAMVTAIAKLGDSLGLLVSAEGIEDGTIQARLRSIGLHKGQGWHFGKPLDTGQIRLLLAERGLLARQPAQAPEDERNRRFG
jgi:diguanylate cyclase (GGDEF)-like protein